MNNQINPETENPDNQNYSRIETGSEIIGEGEPKTPEQLAIELTETAQKNTALLNSDDTLIRKKTAELGTQTNL